MLYYEVTILEEPEHTKEQFEEIASKVLKELEADVGKVYVCDVVDANGNLVDAEACGYTQEELEDEYTQRDFERDKREWEFAREIHKPREFKMLIAVKNLKELEEKIFIEPRCLKEEKEREPKWKRPYKRERFDWRKEEFVMAI